jgi:hypothetical protein
MDLWKKGRHMDSIRSVFGVSVAQLMVLGTMAPTLADMGDGESDHRRLHGRRHAQTISHVREDYPRIVNWMNSPDASDASNLSDQMPS